jgi:hypothetical protein
MPSEQVKLIHRIMLATSCRAAITAIEDDIKVMFSDVGTMKAAWAGATSLAVAMPLP